MIEFEWDKNKAATNEKKQGVGFSEATTVFGDPLELTIGDTKHSSGEYRFLSIGKSSAGNLLVVSYTEKGAEFDSYHQRAKSHEKRVEIL